MNVNGLTSTSTGYETLNVTQTKSDEVKTSEIKNDVAALYEPSATPAPKATYKPDTAMIDKLKADADAKTQQFRTLVENLMKEQGATIGKSDSIWNFLAKGDFEVDAATKAQAQEDISEDGYWGVKQTSDRIVDFATALTGGDPSKLEEMKDAFIKGFEQATETWGEELPEISQQTYDAVIDKFDALINPKADEEA